MRELKAVFQLLEGEMVVLRTKLSDSMQEVIQLKQELSESRGRSIELWQENCKQLLGYDKAMMASERKIQQLEEQLQERELQLARHKLGRLTATVHSVDESKGDLSNLAMTSGMYQPKADFCDTGSVVSSLLPEQSIDRDLVKEETARKFPTAFIPSDSFVTKGMTSHGQPQHVSVTTTISASSLTRNNPEKGMKNKQPILLTQPGPITSNVELSQLSTMPSYLYNRVPKIQWSQPLQHNFDSEPVTSASADNPQVTCVSSSLSNVLSTSRHTCPETTERAMLGDHSARQGKAPPIDLFTVESTEVTFDDWLLTLDRAATWNGWTSSEALMQLTGHLKGRPLQEWKLLTSEHKISYQTAIYIYIKALREELDPGIQTLAALDFRHTTQKTDEPCSVRFYWTL